MPASSLHRKIRGIDDVVDYQLCAGCGACAFLQPDVIQMGDDLASGRRPQVQTGADTDRALAACPGVSLTHDRAQWDSGWLPAVADDWGPVLAVWEGHATDEEIRFRGSSGGAASALALWALERGDCSGVLHTRAKKDVPYLNESTISRNRGDLLEASGSRYAPASPCDGLAELVEQPGPGVLIGKPCDVAGAAMASAVDPGLRESLDLTIAIFCAGAPSSQATLEYVRANLGADPEEIASVRYRGNGWPGEFVAESKNGTAHHSSYAESWGEIQAGRPWRCRICPDHSGEFADVSVGDPWHTPPEPGEAGRSLVIARTLRGKRAIERAIADGYLQLEPVDADLIGASQVELDQVRSKVFGRVLAMRIAGIPSPSFRGLSLFRQWLRKLGLREQLRSVLGTLARLKPLPTLATIQNRGDTVKICILGGSYASKNLGLEALTTSLVHGIWTYRPDAQVVVFDFIWRPDTIQIQGPDGPRSVERHGLNDSRRLWRPECLRRMEWAARFGLPSGPGLAHLRSADLVIDISGGDSFSDLYGMRRFRTMYRMKRLVEDLGRPLILGPQTYGPYQSLESREGAARALAVADQVWARDQESARRVEQLFEELGRPAPKTETGVDLAFALPVEKPGPQVREALATCDPSRAVGLNVSGLIWFGQKAGDTSLGVRVDYRTFLRDLVAGLLERGVERIVLVPHVLEPTGNYESDPQASRELLESLAPTQRESVGMLEGDYGASQVKGLISGLDWFAGSRMHATIAGLSTGVPTAGLAYSLKFGGVFETADVPQAVVDLRSLSTSEACAAALRCFEDRQAQREALRSSHVRLREQALSQIARILGEEARA